MGERVSFAALRNRRPYDGQPGGLSLPFGSGSEEDLLSLEQGGSDSHDDERVEKGAGKRDGEVGGVEQAGEHLLHG